DLGAVAGRESSCQACYRLGQVIQQASILLDTGQTRSSIRGLAVSEQPLEQSSRFILHRHRSGGRPPAERVQISAAEARFTYPCIERGVQSQFQRSQLRVLAEFPGSILIRGNCRANINPVRRFRMDTGEISRAAASVVRSSFAWLRHRCAIVESAQNQEVFAK